MRPRLFPLLAPLLPGLALCMIIALIAQGTVWVQQQVFGHVWCEPLVAAILLGGFASAIRAPTASLRPGIGFSARTVLEAAIVLLGAGIDVRALGQVGPGLILGAAALVIIAIALSYGLSRLVGLPKRLALLVACGNSICGNSAISAAAPVIDADPAEITASIAFTAVLGIGLVLCLPLLGHLIGLSPLQYGVLTGLSVYAVPQVAAATAPFGGALSLHMGTLVKLVRVLMLGPVLCVLGLLHKAADHRNAPLKTSLPQLLPWFIVGFALLMGLRATGVVTQDMAAPLQALSGHLTLIAMTALGLSVDIRELRQSGGRVIVAGALSMAGLIALALGLIAALRLG
ncbi:MAG: putative sulfate exporter family transporter [Asticcacaulis sp.]